MSGRFVYWIAAILALTAVYACRCGTPLIYDGAYQFACTLAWQKPYVYLTRFHTVVLWQPLVWMSKVTSDLKTLTFAFGLPFLLAPVVGLLGSWWMVRRHAPRLILWAMFGIAASLPGQVFVINDSIFQQHLFWPVFFAFMVPLNRWQKSAIAVLVVFQFVHQIGIVLLGGMAGCMLLLMLIGWRDETYRQRMLPRTLVAIALVGWLGFKVWLTSSPDRVLFGYHFGQWYDSYAKAEASWDVAKQRWISGVKGHPFNGLCLLYAAAILLYAGEIFRCSASPILQCQSRIILGAGVTCIFVAGVIWVYWASEPSRWAWALEYRRWVVPLTLPFYLFAFLEAAGLWSQNQNAAEDLDLNNKNSLSIRVPASYLLAAMFAAVLGLQSAEWGSLTRRLQDEVSRDAAIIVPRWELKWSNSSPMAHWATPCYLMVLQGKTPSKLLLESEADPQLLFNEPPEVPLASFVRISPQPGPAGWYDNRPLIESIRKQVGSAQNLGPRYARPY